MVAEIAVENGRISNFEGLVTLTLDRVILHIIMHDSSTHTYMPHFIEIEETFCPRTYVCIHTYICMHKWTFETSLLGRLCRRVNLIMTVTGITTVVTITTTVIKVIISLLIIMMVIVVLRACIAIARVHSIHYM